MADKPIEPLAVIQALAAAWKQAMPSPPPAAPTPDSDTPTVRMMAQALAAAHMPSRDEIAEIAVRLDRIEQSLERIERHQAAPRRPRKSKT